MGTIAESIAEGMKLAQEAAQAKEKARLAALTGVTIGNKSTTTNSNSNPYTTATNPYTTATNPYATATNPYATATNPYATATNPYATATNPYATNPYTDTATREKGRTDFTAALQPQVRKATDVVTSSVNPFNTGGVGASLLRDVQAPVTQSLADWETEQNKLGQELTTKSLEWGTANQLSLAEWVAENAINSGNWEATKATNQGTWNSEQATKAAEWAVENTVNQLTWENTEASKNKATEITGIQSQVSTVKDFIDNFLGDRTSEQYKSAVSQYNALNKQLWTKLGVSGTPPEIADYVQPVKTDDPQTVSAKKLGFDTVEDMNTYNADPELAKKSGIYTNVDKKEIVRLINEYGAGQDGAWLSSHFNLTGAQALAVAKTFDPAVVGTLPTATGSSTGTMSETIKRLLAGKVLS